MTFSMRKNGSGIATEVAPAIPPQGLVVVNVYQVGDMPERKKREYMEKSIEIMLASRREKRQDSKPTPLVGAVLVRPDGTVDTAYRGELREGDHAEFTLIERKHRPDDLTGSTLFATLEPCAPGSRHMPKLGCAERIVNARIKKVYIGIEDPDPTVCQKGIKHLLDHGIEVEMYPRDLQKKIEDANRDFLDAAIERAKAAAEVDGVKDISVLEGSIGNVVLGDLRKDLLNKLADNAGLAVNDDGKFNRQMMQLGLFIQVNQSIVPTGMGYLLLGENPQLKYPQAKISCTLRRQGYKEDIYTIDGPLLEQPKKVSEWCEKCMLGQIDRSGPERRKTLDYPSEVLNELIKNAILHRDYEITGAPIYFEINDDSILIKSPGLPVAPITLESIKNFSAPSLSRNPQIMFVFERMNMAEQRGLGFETVKGLRTKYNIPLPKVSYEEPYLIFTLPRTGDSSVVSDLSEDEQRVVEFLQIDGNLKRIDIENRLGYEKKRTSRLLESLVRKGYVVVEGRGKGTVYHLRDSDSGQK